MLRSAGTKPGTGDSMQIRSLTAGALLLLLAAAAAGCQSESEKVFKMITDSTLGIGVKLGDSAGHVHSVLGEPNGTIEKQGTLNIEEYYLNPDPGGAELPVPDRNTTQFAANYIQGSLARVFNRYHPEDPDALTPPFVIEPLAGIKLGATRTFFNTTLGPPEDELGISKWEFAHEDGRKAVILAHFTTVEGAPEQLCDTLTVTLVQPMSESKGEAFDEREKRIKKIHEGN
jgi:hypothetical protein